MKTENQRQAIHKFMLWKSDIFQQESKTNIKLYTKIDSQDILKKFSDSQIKYIYHNFLLLATDKKYSVTLLNICPWCLIHLTAYKHKYSCQECSYGHRWGICAINNKSKWAKLNSKIYFSNNYHNLHLLLAYHNIKEVLKNILTLS